MLTPEEIQRALHAQRVVPLPVGKFDGPLGLERLAAIVVEISSLERAGDSVDPGAAQGLADGLLE